jgi:hypothetical protein
MAFRLMPFLSPSALASCRSSLAASGQGRCRSSLTAPREGRCRSHLRARAARHHRSSVLIVRWSDHSAWGPEIEFLACVDDMGEARRLAAEADAPAPTKQDRIDRTDPLYERAISRPGVLLWRPDAAIRGDERGQQPPAWREGAVAARAFRAEDAARYNAIRDAARDRRKHRK